MSAGDPAQAKATTRGRIEAVFRTEYGRVVATLIRLVGDFSRAEELVAEAFAIALERWPGEGIPDKPAAWLTTVARNRGLDQLRAESTRRRKHEGMAAARSLEAQPDYDDKVGYPDERLRLIFTCCHPELPMETRVALTLRSLGGLETPEIARAFLVPDATMAQRLVRAKKKIREAGIAYEVPAPSAMPARVESVYAVLYLIFNEGYRASGGWSLMRVDLCDEGIRLARLMVELMPADAEARGLLALMLLHHSRRRARLDARGELVVLEDQDRAQWDRPAIAEGLRVLDEAVAMRAPGPYQVQAAIVALHAQAPQASQTDWPQIRALYRRLRSWVDTPVVRLNEAVAIAMAEGWDAGLARLAELEAEESLAGYHLLPAARADLQRRAGRIDEAREAYERALALVNNDAERRYLERRLAALVAEPD